MTNIEQFPNGFKLYQGENYHFTSDSILLAKFVNFKRSDNVVELCAGSGAIGCYAYSLSPCNHLTFVEIDKQDCEVIKHNITLNNLPAEVWQKDATCISHKDFDKKVDIVICNPPYEKADNVSSQDERVAIARHEIKIKLKDVVTISADILKSKGHLYLVHKAERVAEIIATLSQYHFATKKLTFIKAGNKDPYLVLIDAVLDGKDGVKVEIKENI